MNRKSAVYKITALFLSICIGLVMLYLVAFESNHVTHACHDRECPICHELQIVEQMTRQLGSAVIILASLFAIPTCCKCISAAFLCSVSERNLILDKVRMDN